MMYPDQELKRWDIRLVPSERSLEAVGKYVRLHIISRSKVFDLFLRTYKGKNQCVLRQCLRTPGFNGMSDTFAENALYLRNILNSF